MKKEKNGLFSFYSTNSFSYPAVIMLALCALLAMMLLGGCASAKFINAGRTYQSNRCC